MTNSTIERTTSRDKGFPSHAKTNSEKDSIAYGKQVASMIESEWFGDSSDFNHFYNNRRQYHKKRLYAAGDQSTEIYKDKMNSSLNGDLSYLNLDFTIVQVVPKYVHLVVNGLQNRSVDVKAESVDVNSVTEREKFINRLKGEMKNKEYISQVQEQSGVDLFENKDLPATEEDADMFISTKYRLNSEIAIEKAIQYEFERNRIDQIRYRVDNDLVALGIGAAKHSYNVNDGIRAEYVDPVDLVYSPTEDRFFSDCTYFGEVRTIVYC